MHSPVFRNRLHMLLVACLLLLSTTPLHNRDALAAEAALVLTPDHGSCMTHVVVKGTAFTPGTTVTIAVGPKPGNAFVTYMTQVSAAGDFERQLSVSEFIGECRTQAPGPGRLDGREYLIAATTGAGPRENDPYRDPSASATFTFTSSAADFFQRTWSRTDRPVADGLVERTWMWGPQPFSGLLEEPYAESPDGSRQVQYFDKARMELTQPDADPGSLWYVTNGLLVVELITGRLQVGDETFLASQPAEIPLAGDLDDPDGPTYASLSGLLDAPPAAIHEALLTRLARDGTLSEDRALGAHGITAVYVDEVTQHAIAEPFWAFMTAHGLVWDGDSLVVDALFANPFYATGRPVTEAYWAEVRLAGQDEEVLVQCFERRCLTYTPSNPEGWQVESGNVGLHYFHWRYGPSL